AMLDDFGEAGAQLASRQRGECRRIDDDERGRMKSADGVLAGRRVDSRLATDRGIDHREQRRWNLYDCEPTHVRGRDEAGEVANHTAAKGDDCGVSSASLGGEGIGA